MKIELTDSTIGAYITDVRLAELSSNEWQAIEEAFHERAVLIFPEQFLSDQEQLDFGARFGDLAIESLDFSNERKDGSLRPEDDPVVQLFKGNEDWHTDSSFQPLAAKASILTARKVPSTGGETEWADMRAGYEALDDAMKTRAEDFKAFHSLYYSQSKVGGDPASTSKGLAELHVDDPKRPDSLIDGYKDSAEPPLRSLVKVHPVTKRKALYIGRHAYGIVGLSDAESAQLLRELLDVACQPPRILTHRWSIGDIVIWDNRCVLHRARPWPIDQPRVMHHTRVNGDPATETALNYQ